MTLPRRRVALFASDSTGFGEDAEPSSEGASLPVVTMVIPTKNEAESIDALFDRTERALASFNAEIMIVDDSDDDTPHLVAARQAKSETPVQILHRSEDARSGGLGGAVLAGMRDARAPWVCVMDADLQHPPEVIPLLVRRAQDGDVDLVIASRNTVGQTSDGLSRWRQFVSAAALEAADAGRQEIRLGQGAGRAKRRRIRRPRAAQEPTGGDRARGGKRQG